MVLVGLLLVTGVWDQLMAMLCQFACRLHPGDLSGVNR